MNTYRLTFSSLWHYRRRNLTIALGMAIGMAVITGALVTGDSVRSGLLNLVKIRLGNADLSITSADRYLTDSLAIRMSADLSVPAAPVLRLEGSASAGGGSVRLPKVAVFGVDPEFARVLGGSTFDTPVNENEAVVSDNLARRLNLAAGDEILVRINKPGPIPIDAPFVSNEENIITARLTVKSVAGKFSHGRFNLRNTQESPFNVFVSKKYLQKVSGLTGLSNLILLAGNGKIQPTEAERSLTKNRTLADAGMNLQKHPVTGEWVLRTPRVFFDLPTLAAIGSVSGDKTLWFSYFVNEFRLHDRTTPYSFVSTLPANRVHPGEILINRWLADDLKARTGDSVTLSYFMVGPLRNLTVNKSRFLITGILPMDDPSGDRLLMPEIPGLSDAGNCRDWETSIPIDLSSIRDLDEQYWNRYRGTPKAFINPGQAAEMWQNRFGKYTQVRFPSETNPINIEREILTRLRPSDTGILVREPGKEGNAAASSGVDFSGLFLGLSFFLVAGGIILTFLLIRLGLEDRLSGIGTLRAIGWPEKRIRNLLLREFSVVALPGTLVGLALTFLYTILIFKALNSVWNSIVLTDTLQPVFKPVTLAAGVATGILVSVGTAWLSLKRFFRRRTTDLQRRNHAGVSARTRSVIRIFSISSGMAALAMLAYGLIRIQTVSPTFFFSTGSLMLVSLILMAIHIFRHQSVIYGQNLTPVRLSLLNIYRSSSRSLSVVLLFSIGIFMVIAIGANRKPVTDEPRDPALARHTGTGGFQFYMETTVPVPDNLNNPAVRGKYGLEAPAAFVQMKKLEGDDASCLNLNRVNNPPLLGVPALAFLGRFSFASLQDNSFGADPWKVLEKELPGGAIPAVADQTVIQWGLGLKTGDALTYKAENGDTLKLILMGGLSGSVFQGNILISEKNLTRHWPSKSGTQVMLVSTDARGMKSVETELTNIFRDYGADLKPAAIKLAEYNSVENTYLSIFLIMGALAMLLGTIGLGIILTRNLQERVAELALLRAVGFSKRKILRMVVMEYSVLLIFGTLAGGISALVAVLPGLVGPLREVSPLFLISLLAILLLNGLVWITVLGWNAIRRNGIIQSLRTL